ncbi:MAG: aminotransferase class I/II-fold pyridoxal phosphate-dependent enzyme [Candidatus Hodgkinia cicadicola]
MKTHLGSNGSSALVLKKVKIEHNKLKRNITYLSLSRNIADIYKLKPDNIIFGNGSDEFRNLLCSVFLTFGDEVIICEHMFPTYKTQIFSCWCNSGNSERNRRKNQFTKYY